MQYLRFATERLRPARDLLERIPLAAPERIVDLGCGPGNVTALLAKRWPKAAVLGIDRSETMLAQARAAAPGVRFERRDIGEFTPQAPPTLIYANASLQWLPDHARLLPRLLALLAPGGVLAVQMPVMHAAPYRTLQRATAADGPWSGALAGVMDAPAPLGAEAYWDLLAPRAVMVAIWETTYLHALQGPDAVLRWSLGTSLRPYLGALSEPLRSRFLDAYRLALRSAYPERPDGTTLFPFRRLFLLAGAAAAGRLPIASPDTPSGERVSSGIGA